MKRRCLRPRCSGLVKARGLCSKHYDYDRLANPPVPAAPVAEHIEALHDAGLSYATIGELAGVPSKTVLEIRRNRTVRPLTAERLLGVPLPDHPWRVAPDAALVSPLGSRRRVQALLAIGHTQADLDVELGHDRRCFRVHVLLNADTPYVRALTARRVAEVYERLHMVEPPDTYGARRAKLRAQRRGWAPPMAWDDIDDPNENPDMRERHVSSAERIAELHDLGIRGIDEMAERLGIKRESVKRELARIEERQRLRVAS